MEFLKRILGICATKPPSDARSWRFSGKEIEIDLARTPELLPRGSALRLEGKGIPHRILVVYGNDGRYYAYRNKCTHMGRRVDPVTEGEGLRCCSISKSTFDYSGRVISGPAKGPLIPYDVYPREGKLYIQVEPSPS